MKFTKCLDCGFLSFVITKKCTGCNSKNVEQSKIGKCKTCGEYAPITYIGKGMGLYHYNCSACKTTFTRKVKI